VRLGEIFAPQYRRATICGVAMAVVALITWWSCNAFIPTVASGLAQATAAATQLDKSATLALVEAWKFKATFWFNMGGLLGTLLTIPVAKLLGRKPLFLIYFMASAASLFATFGLDLDPQTRLYMYFCIGLSIFGVFGSFTYYLPELFPTRLRATGAGFCYNIGRVIASIGPFVVGAIAARGASSTISTLFYLGFVPLAGLLLLPLVIETKGRALAD
jgi:MFS family permease